MGGNVENRYIVALIKGKLPEEFKLKLEESREGDWTLAKLRKSISKLIVARERSESSCSRFDDVQDFEYTGEGLLSREARINCCFCDNNHWADECQMFKTVEA